MSKENKAVEYKEVVEQLDYYNLLLDANSTQAEKDDTEVIVKRLERKKAELEKGLVQFKVKKLTDDAVVPTYATEGSAGFDFVALSDVTLPPLSVKAHGEQLTLADTGVGVTVVKVPTGLAYEIPKGYEMQIRGRSSMRLKGIDTMGVGTIDSDYRGEVSIFLVNLKSTPYEIKKGDRIAQGVFAKVVVANPVVVTELTETKRADGGFGSTGK